jgi:hypothetical protein
MMTLTFSAKVDLIRTSMMRAYFMVVMEFFSGVDLITGPMMRAYSMALPPLAALTAITAVLSPMIFLMIWRILSGARTWVVSRARWGALPSYYTAFTHG